MPLVNGKVVFDVPCECGTKVPLSSGTYGTYCPTCGSPTLTRNFQEQINRELQVVIREERLRIRTEKKSVKPVTDWTLGSSAVVSACSMCNSPLTSKVFIVDGEALCEKCLSKTPTCSGCGEHHLKQNMKDGVCEVCKVSFRKCNGCGKMHDIRKTRSFSAGGREWCDGCVDTFLNAKGISFRNYSYKPTPIIFGDKEEGIFYGVELEMDNSSRRKEFMARSHCDEIYYKSDGSLGGGGVEVVTHPATLKYHMNDFPWKNILEAAKKCGYKSHMGTTGDRSSNSPTCGLHIHVNREAFGRNPDERDKREAKLLVLVDKFWDKLVVFSRRDRESLNRWARRYADFDVSKDQLGDIIAKAKDYNGGNRHVSVNFGANGSRTVEFRIFRGTLNKETLIASIQLIQLLVEATTLPTKDVQLMKWEDFCATSKYEEFNKYLERLRDDKKKI